jgi:hypothetical protein
MAILGKSSGLFNLNNSNSQPGSFFALEDLAKIFSTTSSSFDHLPKVNINGVDAIDEKDVQKAWYDGRIQGAPPHRVRNFQRSFDELTLQTLIRLTYPEAEIEEQVKWGRKSLDFIVSHPTFGKKIIEFHGPSHFAQMYSRRLPDPNVRKVEAENDFSMEYVSWPYWIQRCNSNVRAIFEPDVPGYGLLWSATTLFGDFAFGNSSDIILDMTSRFNGLREGGLGYIYGPDTEGRQNAEHPIIKKIENGAASMDRLLPKGYGDKAIWIPKHLL